ncbi:PEP/pyruvate-binding domain-containing protein [Palaeococcus ferrophilus]|uniref:PEP/pyruvate-binding domain-containing protein n=1 Tax=Palaeococcus ferrophilus TaxID=83868 RepID=UPI00064EB5D1|nr:PEP/pyruvate-binding domain-containing protein [Palaeococcus ferrophilus]
MFVRSLSAGGSVDEIGNKAHRLSILTRYLNVPTGFVVTTGAYDLWKEEGKLPPEVVEEVREYLNSPYLLEGKFPVVVRSSATVEDSSKASFAGVFESVTGINSFDGLIKGIERVFESANSERVRNYLERMGLSEEPRMAAIVQREIKPELAGVLFTRSPTEPEKALVEFVRGSGEELVGGKRSAERVLLPRNPEEVQNELMRELIEVGLEAESLFGRPQDIEWAYDGTLWILQSRDITALGQKKEARDIKTENWHALKGIPASPGVARGRARFVLDDQPPEEAERVFKDGEVLVTYVLHAEHYNLFKKASGIVTKVDSILSHPAIIARELGIPCVVGVDVEAIREGDEVIVDGNRGAVYLRNPREVLRGVELWKSTHHEDEIVRALKEEYLRALERLSPEGLENIIVRAFSLVRELYPTDKEKAFNVYYFINWLMEEETPRLLAKRFDVIEALSRADRGERPRTDEEARLFEIYRLLKAFINYTDKRVRDIPEMLFGI